VGLTSAPTSARRPDLIHERTRPLTADERRILQVMLRSPSAGGAPLAALLTFIVISGIGLILLPSSWMTGFPSLAPAGLGAVGAAFVYRRIRRSQRESPWVVSVAKDLAEGIARVTTFHVVDAIRVEEAEDEGSQYYLKLEDGRVAFLAGQYLYELEEEAVFPSRVITVTRAPHSAVVFDAACAGDPLTPSATRPPFSEEEYRRGVPTDGELLDADFASLGRAPLA
jgi:hypothetical protein